MTVRAILTQVPIPGGNMDFGYLKFLLEVRHRGVVYYPEPITYVVSLQADGYIEWSKKSGKTVLTNKGEKFLDSVVQTAKELHESENRR